MIPRRRIQRKWGRKKNFWKNLFSREGEQWRSREQRRVNANFIRCSVWPASPSRVVSNESRHPWKNFSIRRTEGWERFQSPIVIENGAVDRSALPPLCLRFTFAERRNFHPLSSDKSWGRWASDMENRCHERDVSVAGGLHPIEMHLSKIWRRVQQVQANYTSCLSTFFRELHRLFFPIL